MKTKKKIILIAAGVVLALAIVGFSVTQTQKSLVTVQTGRVIKQDITSSVTASGEIKPKIEVNVGANAMGRLSRLFVSEGEHVRKGQLLAQLENVQSASDVAAAKAQLQAGITDEVAATAALRTAEAALKSSSADAAQKKQDYDRQAGLYKAGLISTSDYEAKKAAFDIASAAVAQDQSRVAQAKAQVDSDESHIAQQRAALAHNSLVAKSAPRISRV